MSDLKLQRMLLVVLMVGGAVAYLGLLLCGLFPPPSPDRQPQGWVDFWTAHQDMKRLGVVCGLAGSGCLVVMPVLLFLRLKRTEGPSAPLAYFSLGVGLFSLVPAAILPWLFWSPLVYRNDTLSPDLAQGLSDLGFFTFFLPWPFMIWMIAVATGILRDTSGDGLPRWYAYLTIWIALTFIPGGTLYFFKHGIMAWNGLLPWWMGIITVSIWMVATVVVVWKSLSDQEREEAALSHQVGEPAPVL